MPELPYIPSVITVHLGTPDSDAPNVEIPFPDYIKNVASSEIYPTWPENALRANIYAQISFALNRIYTEYYRSRGYDFDITNSTAYDQSFQNGREIFENIGLLVDELFDTYIYREGNIEPLFAQYCDGIRVNCNGLSQWGTVELANRGLTPYEILTYYYGDSIQLNEDTPIADFQGSVPYQPLRLGDYNNNVRTVQIRLNRISDNYPAIPKIYPVDGVYTENTQNAVVAFQRIFDLAPDGIVGKATWYKIRQIYNSVKRLNDLSSEGLTVAEIDKQYPETLSRGDVGRYVRAFQYFLSVLGQNLDTIPVIAIDGIFGPETEGAVIAFQREYGLPETGVIDERTWDVLVNVYRGIINSADYTVAVPNVPFPGYALSIGMQGDAVRLLQEYLSKLSEVYGEIPPVEVSGVFGVATRDAVMAAQQVFGEPVTGVVTALTWAAIADAYGDLLSGETAAVGQYGGSVLGE